MYKCNKCNKIIKDLTNLIKISKNYYHYSCVKNRIDVCCLCGKYYFKKELNKNKVCKKCLEKRFLKCNNKYYFLG